MEYNNPLIPIADIPQYQEIPLQREAQANYITNWCLVQIEF